jgi:hypothetical protein
MTGPSNASRSCETLTKRSHTEPRSSAPQHRGLLGNASPAPYWPKGRKTKDLWPGGIYDLKIGEHTYQYKNDGTNAGMLWTMDGQGKEEGFSCKPE